MDPEDDQKEIRVAVEWGARAPTAAGLAHVGE